MVYLQCLFSGCGGGGGGGGGVGGGFTGFEVKCKVCRYAKISLAVASPYYTWTSLRFHAGK